MPTPQKEDGHPNLRHLTSEKHRSLITQVRQAVEPILSNNILHHFTDHSVTHSDNLCALVDDLIDELQKIEKRLTHEELIVLYSACYLHDLGMQYENAGATRVIEGLNLAPSWEEISESDRLDLLRKYHHKISAELVAESHHGGARPIGLQLTPNHHAEAIAALCEAHCVTPNTTDYANLMGDSPRLRMPLLSGLLRLADILDESRHRACIDRGRTLLLSLESHTHWWRHHFTKDITVSASANQITIWFEYPKERAEEYSEIIPQLQVPWIEKELGHHREAFNQAGMGWTLVVKNYENKFSNVAQMPELVLMEMLKQIRQKRLGEEQTSREVALKTFKEGRPLVARSLAALRNCKNATPCNEYIAELASLADNLWQLGSRRSAWSSLNGDFASLYSDLSVSLRVKTGIQLLNMLVEDDSPNCATMWVRRFESDLTALPSGDEHKFPGHQILSKWHVEMCTYSEAIEAIGKAISLSPSEAVRELLSAELREIYFLQGEIENVLNVSENGAT